MQREIKYNGNEYQFRYQLIGKINITEGIGVYVKKNGKWKHIDDKIYFDVYDTDEEYLVRIIDSIEQ